MGGQEGIHLVEIYRVSAYVIGRRSCDDSQHHHSHITLNVTVLLRSFVMVLT